MDSKNKTKIILVIWCVLISLFSVNQLKAAQQDTLYTESKKEVKIWPVDTTDIASTVVTDSLLRWSTYRTLDQWLRNESGFRVYSAGTSERQSAIYRLTFEPRHIELFLDGIDLKNPVTGHVDLDRISVRKLQSLSQSFGNGMIRLNASYREHYLNEPRLYLYFDENGANVRNLDVLYSHNLNKDMNIELGYHDLRDGISVYGMNVNSGIIHSRYSWQITPAFRIKSGLQSRIREAEESFGYTESDLFSFTFNPLLVRPLLREKSRTAVFDAFLRADWDVAERFRRSRSNHGQNQQISVVSSGLHVQHYNYVLDTISDSAHAGFKRIEWVTTHRWKSAKWSGNTVFSFRSDQGRGHSLAGFTDAGYTFNQTTLHRVFAESEVVFAHSDRLRMYSQLSGGMRSDDRTSASATGGLSLTNNASEINLYAGKTHYLPDWQSLYWTSPNVSGNPSLLSEELWFSGLHIQKRLLHWLMADAALEVRDTRNTPYLNDSGNFDTAEQIQSLGAMISLRMDRPHVESSVHMTTQTTLNAGSDPYSMWLNAMGSRTMIGGEFFIKGPIYNQAAYTKAGVVSRWVPMNERAPALNPVLNRWQLGTDSRNIPAYAVADFQISTRLRWMMIYLQLENAFNGLGQAGYFEAPGYPMSGRRFIFGIHVLFKN